MKKLFTILLGMMVLTIFAVGCVSAEDVTDIEVPTEEINIDDTVVESVENEEIGLEDEIGESGLLRFDVTNTSDIQGIVDNYTADFTINFSSQNYNNFTLNVTNKTNVIFSGNGATLLGNGVDDIFLVYNCNNITIKDFIIDINGGKHGIYGSDINNAVFHNNDISNGQDGININQRYDNLTITDNLFTDISRDGISLVNNRILSDADWDQVNASIISGNGIDGGQIGIFIGGNFKGLIDDNIIENAECGILFQGKKALTNGRLNATITNNEITAVDLGINMTAPSVYFLNVTGNTIEVWDDYTQYAIWNNTYFQKILNATISVIGNDLNGRISKGFNETCTEFNNTGNYYIDV